MSSAVLKCCTAFRLPGGPLGSKPWTSRLIWLVPRKALKTSAIAPVSEPCAAGYSAWLGVASSGRQPVCSTVAGFPSS